MPRELHISSPLMSGPDVLDVQTTLDRLATNRAR